MKTITKEAFYIEEDDILVINNARYEILQYKKMVPQYDPRTGNSTSGKVEIETKEGDIFKFRYHENVKIYIGDE